MGDSTDRVVLVLTKQQAKDLRDILFYVRDEGPEDEGWASNELLEFRELLDSAAGE